MVKNWSLLVSHKKLPTGGNRSEKPFRLTRQILKTAGIQKQYLTAHSKAFVFRDKNGETIYAMPTGKEREQINQKFDGLILMLKEIGLFHPRKLPEQNLEINKKHLTLYSSKTSIAAIRSLVAEQRQNTRLSSR